MGTWIGTAADESFSAHREGLRWKSWTISGLGGNDILTGGPKKDTIYGGTGHDQISGRGGHDIILGNEGNDDLFGNDGDDRLYGGSGHDSLNGGNGNDLLEGDNGPGPFGDDILYGENGNDRLKGQDGSDYLVGGSGDDVLVGYGSGYEFGTTSTDVEYDLLNGGDGADRFVLGDTQSIYYQTNGSDRGFALIEDFDYVEGDKIQVHGSIDSYFKVDQANGDALLYANNDPNDAIALIEGGAGTSFVPGFDLIAA